MDIGVFFRNKKAQKEANSTKSYENMQNLFLKLTDTIETTANKPNTSLEILKSNLQIVIQLYKEQFEEMIDPNLENMPKYNSLKKLFLNLIETTENLVNQPNTDLKLLVHNLETSNKMHTEQFEKITNKTVKRKNEGRDL